MNTNLKNFVTSINEMSRPKGSKNKPKEWPEDSKKIANDPEIQNAVPANDVQVKKVKTTGVSKVQPGKSADKNGTRGLWACKPPHPKWEEELAKLDIDELDDNAYELSERFDDKHDFLVLGEAGWAKTSVIEQMASTHGYNVLTVYLDKAEATDLGGIPVPSETSTGELYMDYSVPGWALYMLEHPKDKFLLFFDEMNQAAPDVLNALMPIILEHVICGINFGDRILCGAAGNLSYENEGLSDINKPLRDRLKPIIEWETHTPESWKAAFKYLRSKYKDEVGEDIIKQLEGMQNYWNSPRDLVRCLIDFIKANRNREGARSYTRPKSIMSRLKACIWDEVDSEDRILQRNLKDLSDSITKYIKSSGMPNFNEESSGSRKRSKGEDNVHEKDKETLINSLKNGYYFFSEADGGDNEKYLCTVENCITDIFDPSITGITAEVLSGIIRQMEDSGNPPMFKTNDEGKSVAKKSGWKVLQFATGDYLLTRNTSKEGAARNASQSSAD